MAENLSGIALDEMWLNDELNKQGISDIGQVFYAGLDTSRNLFVSKKEKRTEREGEHSFE